jgi:phage terminase large subunit-like protein
MPAAARTLEHVALADQYVNDVLSGAQPACRYVEQACQRHLDDLARWQGVDGAPFYFDEQAAGRVCDIVEHFPHIKGEWAKGGQRIRLQPWQCFILCAVFGWKIAETGTRRFRVAYIETPRKNSKSTISSAVGLYLLACDGEQGAHVISAANTRDQAKIIFSDAQLMVKRERGYCARFGVSVHAHAITQEKTASKFEALSGEYSNLDGLNLHAALIDELHAHPTRGLWDVLETAMGARSQPLMWAVTTAGTNRASVCYDQRSHVIAILNRTIANEGYFGIIYTCDAGDDPWDEATWIKANPNYGISMYPRTLRNEGATAQAMPSMQHAFLMKHLNIWVNADTAWLPPGAWDKCADPALELEDFAGMPCYMGVDLARCSDIAAVMLAFPPFGAREYWAVFGRYYLPEETINRGENQHYQGWEAIGRLTGTPGAVTNFPTIVDTMAELAARVYLNEIAIDPFDAGPFVALLEPAGLPQPIEVRQNAANMSPAMVELEALVLARKIRHDGDPVLAWMMTNVVCTRASSDLLYPRKESEEKKIDGVTALLMVLHRAMKREAAPTGRGAWLIGLEEE